MKDEKAAILMQDAFDMQEAALERLDAGDWRDAAEKAWRATRNATQALVLEVNGADNRRSNNVEMAMRGLARERGGEWLALRSGYSEVVHYLHAEAFYGGAYTEDVPDIVRGVTDYIRLAQRLAES